MNYLTLLAISLLLAASMIDARYVSSRLRNSTSERESITPKAGEKAFDLMESVQASWAANFPLRAFVPMWISDTEFFYTENTNYVIYNIEEDASTILSQTNVFTGISVLTSTLSPKRKYILAESYRTNKKIRCKVLDISTGNVINLNNDGYIQVCKWLRGGKNDELMYIEHNNVYLWRDGVVTQITNDGQEEVVINGGTTDASFYSSPNGNLFAFTTTILFEVPVFKFDVFGNPGSLDNQYPFVYNQRYTKPGHKIRHTTINIIDLGNIENTVKITSPVDDLGPDCNIAEIDWLSDTNLIVSWLNRRQNKASFQSCNINTGACVEIKKLDNPTGWVDYPSVTCSSTAHKCFYISENNNWRHIFELGPLGSSAQRTEGEITVENILKYDSKNDLLYYTAVPSSAIQERHVYVNNKCLSCDFITPETNKCTFSTADFSYDASYYALICTGPDPTFSKLFSTGPDGKEIKMWESNQETRTKLESYQSVKYIFDRMPVVDGFNAAYKLTLPSDFDIESSEKLPMIVYVYGGPNGVYVQHTYSIGYQSFLVTNRRVIYCQIDGRGTRNKGMDMYFTINNRLGSIEMQDQIAVTKQLIEKYSFIDSDRVGIWGWSYGGYSTSMILAQDSEKIFKAGVAVAPVTSWIYYNSIYTERYMGFPTPEDNLQGYIDSDVTLRVSGIAGKPYLLIHGNGDDNVHYQHAMALTRALQKNEIPFESMSYPDEDHNLGGVYGHFYATMTHFWDREFSLNEAPVLPKAKIFLN